MRRFRLLFAAGAIVLLAVFGAAQASSADRSSGSFITEASGAATFCA